MLLASGNVPYRICAVQSGSMSPGIPTKSTVVVHTERDYAPGDVIAFNVGDNVTTHRLIEIEADGTYVTKGDAVEQVDPFPITESDVVARVTASVPELGCRPVYLQQPFGMFSVIAGAIGPWLIWSGATDLGREEDEEGLETKGPTSSPSEHQNDHGPAVRRAMVVLPNDATDRARGPR